MEKLGKPVLVLVDPLYVRFLFPWILILLEQRCVFWDVLAESSWSHILTWAWGEAFWFEVSKSFCSSESSFFGCFAVPWMGGLYSVVHAGTIQIIPPRAGSKFTWLWNPIHFSYASKWASLKYWSICARMFWRHVKTIWVQLIQSIVSARSGPGCYSEH